MKQDCENRTQEQFELFYNEYSPFIFFETGKFFQQMEDREDCAQTILLRLLERSDSFLQLSKEKKFAYILTSIRNYAIDRLRKDRHYPQEELNDNLTSIDDLTINLVARERNRLLYRCLTQISDASRSLIEMYYFYGYDKYEISKKLHISPDSVRTYLSRARKALKKKLYENGYNSYQD